MAGYTGELLARTASLEMPVLVLWGSEDRPTPAQHAEAFGAAVPHAEVKVLDRCGHYPQLELPTSVTRLLDDFLGARAARVRALRNGAAHRRA
jgi:pimeloyl-ACP methyl ester carboxylesterase